MVKLKRWILICIFSGASLALVAQNFSVSIDSTIQLITTHSYHSHFDSLRTLPFCNRKVMPIHDQSSDHDNCRNYIYRSFQNFLGNENCYLNYFVSGNYGGLANVIGVKKGSDPGKGIWIIGAHYDSNNANQANQEMTVISPGANDNGTGVAALLEIARIISKMNLDATVILAAWDLEEIFTDGYGTGSNNWFTKFVKKWKPTDWEYMGNKGTINKDDIRGNINFDMIGNPQNFDNGKPVLWACYAKENQQYFTENYAATVNKYVPQIKAVSFGRLIWSDHYTFAANKIPAVENLESGYLNDPYYHTYDDNLNNPDNIDFDFATNVTKGGLAFLLEQVLGQKTNMIFQDEYLICTSETPSYYCIQPHNANSLTKIYSQFGNEIWKTNGYEYQFSPPWSGWYYIRETSDKTVYTQTVYLKKKKGSF